MRGSIVKDIFMTESLTKYAQKKIVEVVYGLQSADYVGSASDILVGNGWIKLTTSAMLPYYIQDGMYYCLSYDQVRAIREWANDYKVDAFEKERWWND